MEHIDISEFLEDDADELGFYDLPYEIVFKIFSLLDVFERASAARVCRLFQRVSYDSGFHLQVHFGRLKKLGVHVDDRFAEAIASRLHYTQHLLLNLCTDVTNDGFRTLGANLYADTLRSLSLNGLEHFSDDDARALFAGLAQQVHTESQWSASNNDAQDDGEDEDSLDEAGHSEDARRKAGYAINAGLVTTVGAELSEAELDELVQQRIQQRMHSHDDDNDDEWGPNNTSHSTSSKQAEEATHTPALQVLDLSFCEKLTADGMQAICTGAPNLQHIIFKFGSGIDDVALAVLGRELHNLRSLSLEVCTHVTDEGITAIATGDGTRATNQLRMLKLNGLKQLTDDSLSTVARTSPHLQALVLTGCKKLSDATLYALAHHCAPRLRDLRFNRCPDMSDAGLLAIARACTHLKTIHCDLSPQGRAVFMQRFPHIQLGNVFLDSETWDAFINGSKTFQSDHDP